MAIRATINVARIVQAMEAKQLKVVDTCALCGINNKTLAKILSGELPKRIDALYRLLNGLQIPVSEALTSASTHQTARLYVLPDRRSNPQVA